MIRALTIALLTGPAFVVAAIGIQTVLAGQPADGVTLVLAVAFLAGPLTVVPRRRAERDIEYTPGGTGTHG